MSRSGSGPPWDCPLHGSKTSTYACRERLLRLLSGLPPFTRPRSREAALGWIRELRRVRRTVYERCGSARYSRPALHNIDRQLERYLPGRPGLFVEVGAYDGYRYSNTYYLERWRNWQGVLIEPIPASFLQCVRDRPRSRVFNCALVADDGPDHVAMTYVGPGSATSGTPRDPAIIERGTAFGWERTYDVTVPARPLTSVLDEAGVTTIDFMSIDVEGFELEVLGGLDLERFLPKFILIETNGADRAIAAILEPKFSLIAHFSPNDAFFRRRA